MEKKEFQRIANELYDSMKKDGEANLYIIASDGKSSVTYLKGNPAAISIDISVSIEQEGILKDIIALVAEEKKLYKHEPSDSFKSAVLAYCLNQVTGGLGKTMHDIIKEYRNG